MTDPTTGAGVRQTPAVPISVYREIATELKATQALVNSLNQQNQRLDRENQLLRQEILKFTEAAAHLKVVAGTIQGVALASGSGAEANQSTYPAFPSIDPPFPELSGQGYKFPQPDSLSLDRDNSLATLGVEDLSAGTADPFPESVVYSGGSIAISGLASQVTKLFKPQTRSSPKPTVKAKRKPSTPSRPKPQPTSPVLYTEQPVPSPSARQSTPRTTEFSGLWLATTILLVVVSAFGAGFLVMKPLLNNSR
ncbi:MAG: hypothetical protein ACKO63_17620 [Nodosilinea sp.]